MVLYDHSSLLITLCLFLAILIANEISFHFGRYVQNRTDDEIKSLTGAVQASVLGLLALLLGFTFSMSMQRYDSRNQALIEEANAIGTAQLRTELLASPFDHQAKQLLDSYVHKRIQLSHLDLTEVSQRDSYFKQLADLQKALWSVALAAAEADPRAVTSGYFINALNGVFDAQTKRTALLQMHVPEVVILLLFLVFIASSCMLGYSAGLTGKRIVTPSILISFLIALIVFIIIDLDRPRRGFIQVDQSLLTTLV